MLGDGAFHVALAWQVYDLSSQPTALSLVLAARSIPMLLLLLVGGAVTDRVPRRLIMLASDVTRGAAVTLLAVLAATDSLVLWHIVVLAAVFGAADAFFWPSYTSILPEILETDLFLQANALEAVVRPLAIAMVGPALGGLVVARVGTAAAFAFDALTFGVSVAALLAMQARGAPGGGRSGMRDEVREGFRYARAEPWIWVTLVVAAFSVLFAVGPFDVLIPLIVRVRLRAGADAYGVIIAARGAGAILAALIVSQLGNPRLRITAAALLEVGLGLIQDQLGHLRGRLGPPDVVDHPLGDPPEGDCAPDLDVGQRVGASHAGVLQVGQEPIAHARTDVAGGLEIVLPVLPFEAVDDVVQVQFDLLRVVVPCRKVGVEDRRAGHLRGQRRRHEHRGSGHGQREHRQTHPSSTSPR